MGKLYLTLGDKGGIGKSFIAALMAQYILDNMPESRPICLDLDCKNMTFSRYTDLGVELIDVRTEGDIDRSRFDLLVNRAVNLQDNERDSAFDPLLSLKRGVSNLMAGYAPDCERYSSPSDLASLYSGGFSAHCQNTHPFDTPLRPRF